MDRPRLLFLCVCMPERDRGTERESGMGRTITQTVRIQDSTCVPTAAYRRLVEWPLGHSNPLLRVRGQLSSPPPPGLSLAVPSVFPRVSSLAMAFFFGALPHTAGVTEPSIVSWVCPISTAPPPLLQTKNSMKTMRGVCLGPPEQGLATATTRDRKSGMRCWGGRKRLGSQNCLS